MKEFKVVPVEPRGSCFGDTNEQLTVALNSPYFMKFIEEGWEVVSFSFEYRSATMAVLLQRERQ